MADWTIGIIFSVASNVLSSVSVHIQKIAHNRIALEIVARKTEEAKEAGQLSQNSLSPQNDGDTEHNAQPRVPSYVCNPIWLSGLMVQGIGNVCDVVALNYAPQTIIGPLGGLLLVINMVFSSIIQKERVSIPTVTITLLITFGAILSIVFSPKSDAGFDSVDDVIAVYKSIHFLFYSNTTIALLTALWTASKWPQHRRFCFPAFCGIVNGQIELFVKGMKMQSVPC